MLSCGDTDLHNSGGINAMDAFETMFRFLQAESVGWVHGSLDGVGDANKHPDLLEKARQLGEKLAA